MRFLVDESTGPWVAQWLREHGHEVFSVFEQARGMDDNDIIQKAFSENWVLLTNDKISRTRFSETRSRTKGLFYCGWIMNEWL